MKPTPSLLSPKGFIRLVLAFTRAVVQYLHPTRISLHHALAPQPEGLYLDYSWIYPRGWLFNSICTRIESACITASLLSPKGFIRLVLAFTRAVVQYLHPTRISLHHWLITIGK